MSELFTVHKYRVQWIFKTPITGSIIAEGETGDAHYIVEYNDDNYQAGGVHPGHCRSLTRSGTRISPRGRPRQAAYPPPRRSTNQIHSEGNEK